MMRTIVGHSTADDQAERCRRTHGDREHADHAAGEALDIGEIAVLEEARRRDEDVPDECDGGLEREPVTVHRWPM